MIDNMLSTFQALLKDDPNAPLNFREVFKNELFRLSLIQVSLHLQWLVMVLYNFYCRFIIPWLEHHIAPLCT
jgi:hypothetical protein